VRNRTRGFHTRIATAAGRVTIDAGLRVYTCGGAVVGVGRMDDEALVRLAAAGEPEAFDALFVRYLDLVREEARRMGRGRVDGDEVAQETFVRAYVGLGQLTEPGKFAPWLRTIARRVCIAERRRQERTVPLDEETVATGAGGDPALSEFLASLPAEEREPLHLHYVLGLDTESAAKAMGVSPGAFRVRLHRLRERLSLLAYLQSVEERVVVSGKPLEDLPEELVAEAMSKPADIEAWSDDWRSFRNLVEHAYQLDPTNDGAALLLGRKLAADGEYRAAIKVLAPLWQRAPSAWCGLTAAWCLDYLGDREEAIRWYGRVAALTGLSETERTAATDGIERPQTPKKPPTPPEGLVQIRNTGWTATASHDRLPPGRAVDGDTRTLWSPADDCQQPGMWFRVDLGERVEGVAGLWLDDDAGGESIYQNAAPRHCLISVSVDGEWWKRVAEWRWRPNRYLEAWWEPVPARYLLLEQIGSCGSEWWCIYEAHMFHARG
jgi:DNA-directed RNA polymerase specialized sigma24 family protein